MGRATYKVNTAEQQDKAYPRLDILVTYHGKNLCIVEVKRDTEKLDEDDIKQATSYARLLDDIPPFCLLTNGKEYWFIDTISRCKLSKEDLAKFAEDGYTVSIPDTTYYEAVKYFVGYSKENLINFCSAQVLQYLSRLKGSKVKPDRKYIQDLYASDIELDKELESFISSEDKSFVVVANSGMGKTCWICNTVEIFLAKGFPIFFYRAKDVKNGIFSAINEDLNWNLSQQFGIVESVKRFFKIFATKPVMIFIDGLDEIPSTLARELTDDFLKRVPDQVKLVATCKYEVWNRLLVDNDDIPTMLSETVATYNGQKGYRFTRIGNDQFGQMVKKYRDFYNFAGSFQDEVYEDCKNNPFLLRVMFDVAASKQLPHLTYTIREFYDEYYNRILRRFETDQESIHVILCTIAECMYLNNVSAIGLSKLRTKLGYSANDQLPERLFELDILERENNECDTEISFYFSKLRDYLIIFKILQLSSLSPQDIRKQDFMFGVKGVQSDVLDLFYLLASEEQKRAFDGQIYHNALKYITFYQGLLDEHFSAFKEEFSPFTKDTIGFIGYLEVSLRRMLMHGLRAIQQKDARVLLLPSHLPINRPNNLASLHGLKSGLRMKSGQDYFVNINIHKEVYEEVKPNLTRIIETGKLNESESSILISEKLFAICHSYFPMYFGIDSRRSGIFKSRFSLNTLKKAVLTERTYRKLEHDLVEFRLKNDQIPVTQHKNGGITYSYHLTNEDVTRLKLEAEDIGQKGIFIDVGYTDTVKEEFERMVLQNINTLEQLGLNEVVDPLKVRRENLDAYNHLQWGYPVDYNFATKLMEELISVSKLEYTRVIKHNFPTMQEPFNLTSYELGKYFVFLGEWDNRMNSFSANWFQCEKESKLSEAVKVCLPEEIIYDYTESILTYKGLNYKIKSRRWDKFDLSPHFTFTPFRTKGEYCLIRNMVYSKIHKQLQKILNHSSLSI